MSGVWVFKNNGVIRLVENPAAESNERNGGGSRRKVLVHLPSGQVVTSYPSLEQILKELGWERYYGGGPDLFQFHKHASIDLISLPRDFSKFNSVYMYDIVIKNPNMFHVRDIEENGDSTESVFGQSNLCSSFDELAKRRGDHEVPPKKWELDDRWGVT
ncbi:hypothetical protein D5086_014111 [Populus alba]|uniref:Uncharacterized protein n=2 Tax=Populus TaxID=3689 RepID=A0ACC4C6W8_POPAL|nr:hypothetical protein POTOM_024404 [Populus tomentosa]